MLTEISGYVKWHPLNSLKKLEFPMLHIKFQDHPIFVCKGDHFAHVMHSSSPVHFYTRDLDFSLKVKHRISLLSGVQEKQRDQCSEISQLTTTTGLFITVGSPICYTVVITGASDAFCNDEWKL